MTVAELMLKGYKVADVKYQRGYIRRKNFDFCNSEIMTAGGSRKGQFYVLIPCMESTRYCKRVYFKAG